MKYVILIFLTTNLFSQCQNTNKDKLSIYSKDCLKEVLNTIKKDSIDIDNKSLELYQNNNELYKKTLDKINQAIFYTKKFNQAKDN